MATIPFDDRDGFIWFDGKMVPWREAKVHFLTHALHYGSGVFEGIRAYGGHIFKLLEHSQRLLEGCKIMDIKPPFPLEDIKRACEESVRINKINDGYIANDIFDLAGDDFHARDVDHFRLTTLQVDTSQ